jgi:hypothetical protein
LIALMPANEISLVGPYERPLRKCCNDPLRPPLLSECGFLVVKARPDSVYQAESRAVRERTCCGTGTPQT